MLRAELKKIWQNKMLLLTIIAISFVPILYAGIFLKSVWDPYGKLSALPVAVVNEDKPVDYNGRELSVGKQVVETLRKDNTFKWEFVDAKTANKGMQDDKYYMTVTIPSDFSAKAATVTNISPEQMNLVYKTNGSLNYPLETISKSAAEQLKAKISAQVTLAYANSIIGTIKETGNNIQAAADGAGQLNDGIKQADSGIGQMKSSTPALADGVNQLATGGNSLNSGVNQLVSQTKASGQRLKQSLPDLAKLNNGAHQLSTALDSSIKANQDKVNKLNSAINLYGKEIDDVNKLVNSEQYDNFIKAIEKLQGDSRLDEFLNQAVQNGSITEQQKKDFIDTLDTVDDKLKFAKNTPDSKLLKSDLQTLVDGLNSANAGAKQIADGTQQVYNQMSTMSNQLNSPETLANLNLLSNGAGQLSSGLNQLNGQIPTLVSGVNQLSDGAKQLVAGSGELQTKLQDGATTIKNTPLSSQTADMIANPMSTKQEKYSSVKNYGHGFAPYFLSVSLFVGCMMFNFAYPIRKIADKRRGWFGWYVSKAAVGMMVATAMAIIIGSIMMMLGLEVEHFGQFFGLLILYTNAMMFLIMFLAISFDNPGRFVAMVILILSLGAAGGTFPVETAPKFYQVIHPFMPMSYTILGLKQSISSGINHTDFIKCFAVLGGILIANLAFLALSMYVMHRRHGNNASKSRLDDNQKLLSDDYSNYTMKHPESA